MAARPHLLGAAGLVAVGLLLGGCSARQAPEPTRPSASSGPTSPSPEPSDPATTSEQSAAAACAELSSSLESLQSGLTENFDALQSDPNAAADAIEELSATFSAASSTLTNTEVKPVADRAGTALANMSDAIATVAADPAGADQAAITTAVTDFQAAFTELGQVCASAGASLGG